MISSVQLGRLGTVLVVEFDDFPTVEDISTDKFALYTNEATPEEISTPFKPSIPVQDYNPDTRRLYLYFREGVSLDPEQSYILYCSGIQDASGITSDEESVEFVTTRDTIVVLPDTTDDEVTYEDHSIRGVDYAEALPDAVSDSAIDSGKLNFLTSDPVSESYYIELDYNDGLVTLEFDKVIDDDFLESPYIKVQKRKVQLGPSRWETISDAAITKDAETVEIQFPEEESGVYFAVNYIYRIVLSKRLQSTSEEATPQTYYLESDVVVRFNSGFDPMVIDLDTIISMLDDIQPLEIAEWAYRASLVVQAQYGNDELPVLAYDYVMAATLCALSRIHPLGFVGGMYGTSAGERMMLGDFSVDTRPNSSGGSGIVNRANASSWCELAEALRIEMLTANGGIKSAVKAINRTAVFAPRKIDPWI